jgi:hypothetical protein
MRRIADSQTGGQKRKEINPQRTVEREMRGRSKSKSSIMCMPLVPFSSIDLLAVSIK